MDEKLRLLQRLAANGSEDAQKRYVAALERAVGFSSDDTPEMYQAKDRQWHDKKLERFEPEPVIYRDKYCPMLHVYFKGLPDLGFAISDFPEEKWDWLLGSISSQVARIAELAYQLGQEDTQKKLQEVLGLR